MTQNQSGNKCSWGLLAAWTHPTQQKTLLWLRVGHVCQEEGHSELLKHRGTHRERSTLRGTRTCCEQAAQHQIPMCFSSQSINMILGCMNIGAVCKSSIFLINGISNKMNNRIKKRGCGLTINSPVVSSFPTQVTSS